MYTKWCFSSIKPIHLKHLTGIYKVYFKNGNFLSFCLNRKLQMKETAYRCAVNFPKAFTPFPFEEENVKYVTYAGLALKPAITLPPQ